MQGRQWSSWLPRLLLLVALLAPWLMSGVEAGWADGDLLFTTKEDYVDLSGPGWELREGPYDIDQAVFAVTHTSGKVGVEVTVSAKFGKAKPKDMKTVVVKPGDGTVTFTVAGLKNSAIIVHVKRAKLGLGAEHFRIRISRPNMGKPWQPKKNALPPVCGFVDTHIHQMADLGFGGVHFKHKHDEDPSKVPRVGFQAGTNREQQAHTTFLKEAYDDGLNLAVVSVVNNDIVCRPFHTQDCSDMPTAIRQVRAIHRYAEKYSDWYQVAYDPWHAREIIHSGKMAIVIALEVSDLFPAEYGAWLDQLHELYDMGVRSFQVVHEIDNDFCGAAPHRWPLEVLQFLKHGHIFRRVNGLNSLGLTADGKDLIRELKRLNALIDSAHMSHNAVSDLAALVNNGDSYPVFDSHCRFQDVLTPESKKKFKELVCDKQKVDLIKRAKGVIGLRTGPDPMDQYTPLKPSVKSVPQSCDGSAVEVAQLVQFGVENGVSMGIGSDFNGFALMSGPRFGKNACPNPHGDSKKERNDRRAGQVKVQQQENKHISLEYDANGFAHIGLEGDFVRDLHVLGADISGLVRSAEVFLRMWERTYGVENTSPMDVAPGATSKMRCVDYTKRPRAPAEIAPSVNELKALVLNPPIAPVDEAFHDPDTA